jgi:hypothetical protein
MLPSNKSASKALAACAVLFTVHSVDAQQTRRATLDDYIGAQRAAVEADIAKQNQAVVMLQQQIAPPKPKDVAQQPVFVPEPVLMGINRQSSKVTVEVSLNGRTYYTEPGRDIGMSGWKLSRIDSTHAEFVLPGVGGSETRRKVQPLLAQ